VRGHLGLKPRHFPSPRRPLAGAAYSRDLEFPGTFELNALPTALPGTERPGVARLILRRRLKIAEPDERAGSFVLLGGASAGLVAEQEGARRSRDDVVYEQLTWQTAGRTSR